MLEIGPIHFVCARLYQLSYVPSPSLIFNVFFFFHYKMDSFCITESLRNRKYIFNSLTPTCQLLTFI